MLFILLYPSVKVSRFLINFLEITLRLREDSTKITFLLALLLFLLMVFPRSRTFASQFDCFSRSEPSRVHVPQFLFAFPFSGAAFTFRARPRSRLGVALLKCLPQQHRAATSAGAAAAASVGFAVAWSHLCTFHAAVDIGIGTVCSGICNPC